MATSARGTTAEQILQVGLLVVCLVLFLTVPLLLDRGIDLTDEGAYLNSIATPGLYPHSLSLYGFAYHPLLTASAYNIVLLRWINYAALITLTLMLVVRATYTVGVARSSGMLGRVVLWAAFTTSALFFYCIWLPTPSYNSFNVCGALLLAYALVGIASSDRLRIQQVVIAGVGLSICALAKPTSGAALAALLLVSMFRARPVYVWSLLAMGVLSAILCSATLLCVRGSPATVIQSYREGVLLATGLLGDRSTADIYLWRSWPFPVEFLYIVLVCVIATIAFLVTEHRSSLRRWAIPARFAAFSALLALCVYIQFRTGWWNRPLNWTPALFAIVLSLCNLVRTERIHIQYLRLALLLLMIPFAIGLGSNTGLLRSAAQAAPIWAVASLFIIAMAADGESLQTYARQIAISSVIAAAVVVAWAVYFPQRQVAPLWTQQAWMSAHGREKVLRVDPKTAEYFHDLSSSAWANGFSEGTAVIDLTGTAATTVYVLGGEAIGDPYFSGGWPGSDWMVERSLRSVSRNRLTRAWVLTRAPASDTLDPKLLRRLGLDFPQSYEPVGRATPPAAVGEQTLWKPKKPVHTY